MDSVLKFNDKQLPKREDSYSLLTDEDISDDDYRHAEEVWNAFGKKNVGEYHDSYQKSDILLLADVFENFRETCLEYYGVDPAHYVSAPGLTWDAMLKMTGINLELITDDIDQQLFIEKGMRGGISYIAHRHARANNKYMKIYNPENRKTYIIYLDANNLYGWAMIQPLPYAGFQWVEPKKYEEEEGIGHIYEVDLEYPEELHYLHNDYPLAPEKIRVSDDMLSDYCREIKNKFKISNGKVHKLVLNLNDKERYVLHEKKFRAL